MADEPLPRSIGMTLTNHWTESKGRASATMGKFGTRQAAGFPQRNMKYPEQRHPMGIRLRFFCARRGGMKVCNRAKVPSSTQLKKLKMPVVSRQTEAEFK